MVGLYGAARVEGEICEKREPRASTAGYTAERASSARVRVEDIAALSCEVEEAAAASAVKAGDFDLEVEGAPVRRRAREDI